ncbi:LamG domain-containing protein [Schlesneria sp.]|uniref:LamG domain-containing protein n=1 Tax=Schlesneria sp. TaxID=2762018 RepID=UPI002F06DCC0
MILDTLDLTGQSMVKLLPAPYARGAEMLSLRLREVDQTPAPGSNAASETIVLDYHFNEYYARYGVFPTQTRYVLIVRANSGPDAVTVEIVYSDASIKPSSIVIPPRTFAGTSFVIPEPPGFNFQTKLTALRQKPKALSGTGASNFGLLALLGNIAKLAWILGWEKDQLKALLSQVRLQRSRAHANGYSLDLIGDELRVPRFPPREYSYDAQTIALYHCNDPATGTIIGTTGSGISPIVITSLVHGLATGQNVTINGVAGNTSANGTFNITSIDEDRFSLAGGAAGNGEFAGGGSWLLNGVLTGGAVKGLVIDETTRFGKTGHPGFNAGATCGVTGKFNAGLQFPGPNGNGFVRVPHDASFNLAESANFTIEFFVKADPVNDSDLAAPSAPRLLACKGAIDSAANHTEAGWSMMLATWQIGGTANNLRWEVSDGGTVDSILADIDIADGRFHHIAGVIDRERSGLRLFVDGDEILAEAKPAGASILGAVKNNKDLLFGNNAAVPAKFQFSGVLDEVRLSSVARTEFHPVLGEGDEPYGKRLGLFQKWFLPTAKNLRTAINDLVHINGQQESFELIEKLAPSAVATKTVRIVPETLPIGQSLCFEGNPSANEVEACGRPSDDVDFLPHYLIGHYRHGVNYGSDLNNHLMQPTTLTALQSLIDLLVRQGVSGNLNVLKSYDPADPGLHSVGRELQLSHDSLVPEVLSIAAHQAGFDFVLSTPTHIDVSMAIGNKLAIAIKSLTPISTATETGTTVTITTSVPHKLVAGERINILNVSHPGYHGTVTITAVTASTIQFNLASSGLPAATGGMVEADALPSSDGYDAIIGGAINLVLCPENLPATGRVKWTIIHSGAGRAHLLPHPLDEPNLRTPITSRRHVQLFADAPGEVDVSVEFAFAGKTVVGTRTLRIGITSLPDKTSIAWNGARSSSEETVVGSNNATPNSIYLITSNVAGIDYGTDPNNKRMVIALEKAFNRLTNLASALPGLRVIKAFDPAETAGRHQAGRGILLAHSTLPSDQLGALAHRAGFDYVRTQGTQVYCSVAEDELIEIVPQDSTLVPLEEHLFLNKPIILQARFGRLPVQPITNISQTGTTVTTVTGGPHGFQMGMRIAVAGVLISGYNGVHTITEVPSATSFKYQTISSGFSPAAGSGTVTSGDFNWALQTDGFAKGTFDYSQRSQVKFTPTTPGVITLQQSYFESNSETADPYSFEVRVKEVPGGPTPILSKDQYDLIMNLLNYFHPIGVQVVTENLRHHVKEIRRDERQAFPAYTYPDFRS